VECTSLQPTTSAGCHAAYIMVLGFYKRHGTRAATRCAKKFWPKRRAATERRKKQFDILFALAYNHISINSCTYQINLGGKNEMDYGNNISASSDCYA